jgi:hypothetical protein
MCTAKVIQLPGAAESRVVQERIRGRLPNSVARLRYARSKRDQLRLDEEYIQRKVEIFERIVACTEQTLADARYKLEKFRAVEPGSPVVIRLREYDFWLSLGREERERLIQCGQEPIECPL